MKVLVGGSTFLQARPPKRQQISKIDVPRSIIKGLQDLGHEVDWRVVTIGEDLSGYDLIWHSLAPINSLNARCNALGSMWALSQTHIPRVALWDDWQTRSTINAYRNVAKLGMGQFSKYLVSSSEWFYPEASQETLQEYCDVLVQACLGMLGPLWATGMVSVIPAYTWGDRSIVRKNMPTEMGPIWALDPSPTILEDILLKVEPLAEKERKWTMAALMPHDKWLDKLPNEWPIELIGKKTIEGSRLKTEVDVLERYNHSWGALSPPYFSAGSGWWRSRFLYAARVGSVLVCDKGEGAALGRAYNLRVPQVEAATDDGLLNMAEEQRNALRPYFTSMDYFQATLAAILEDAVQRQERWKSDHEVLSTP